MSLPLTPSKRPHDDDPTEPDGKEKLQKLEGDYSENHTSKSSRSGFTFRVLCPVSKIDVVIGIDGEIMSQISQETGVTIRVEDTVSGSDERSIVIEDSDGKKETSEYPEAWVEQSENNGGEEANVANESDDKKEECENNVDREPVLTDGLRSQNETSNLQKALLHVFERIVEMEPDIEAADEENKKLPKFIFRLLVFSSQVGCILGKGGCVIKQMSAESAAEIRFLPRDKLPMCALASDEVVQITGEVDAVRKALELISDRLLDNSPRDHESVVANPTGPSQLPPNQSFSSQRVPSTVEHHDGADTHSAFPSSVPKSHESGATGRQKPTQEILTFRLLCYDERVGGVIGKGGAIIRALKQETGCDIKVMEALPDTDDRLIIISGAARPDDTISAPQDAVLRVQTRIARAIPDKGEKPAVARLLVASNQIGYLLGKGGSVIAEMRKLSRAYIRIMGKDQIPKCASEDEEVVLITGEFEAIQEALLQITTRLRHNFFRDAFHSNNHPLNPGFKDQVSPFPSFMGRREVSPPGRYSKFGPSFHKFDAIGGPPLRGGFHPHGDHSLFMHRTHRPGMPPHMPERKPWGPQGRVEVGGSIGFPDFAVPPHRRLLGFGGASQPPIITSNTVEVVVPCSIVPIIRGEDGVCLKQVRQISDAKITITDPKPGATETVIVISGTPEQTHAAESLIQAFVMSEAESA